MAGPTLERLYSGFNLSATPDGNEAAKVTPDSHGTLVINFTKSGAATVEVFETDADDLNGQVHTLNGGTAPTAGANYSFEIPCIENYSYAIRPDGAAATFSRLTIDLEVTR